MKKHQKDFEENREDSHIREFLDMIAPSVIWFETDHFICGNTYRCVWAIREYPTATDEQAILSHLGEKDGVTLHIYTRHVTAMEEKRIISNAVNKNRLDRSSTNDLQQTVLAESNLQDVTAIVAQMHRNREPLLHTAVYLELCAHDLERFKLLQTEVLTELIRAKLNVDRLLLRQQQGFRCVMPTGRNLFGDQFERVLPASSVANLYPFHYSGKTDPNGFYVGKDKFGSNVIVDFNRRTDDKTNANILILGNSGQESSDPKYSFHWTGKSGRLYVFEAPIDLLSFLTLYQKEWEQHSYVALCGLSEQGLFQMLEDVPYIRQVALCLDRDRAGLQAEERIQKNLEGRGYREVFPLFPSGKDWNEDLQELMAKGRRENLQMQ